MMLMLTCQANCGHASTKIILLDTGLFEVLIETPFEIENVYKDKTRVQCFTGVFNLLIQEIIFINLCLRFVTISFNLSIS